MSSLSLWTSPLVPVRLGHLSKYKLDQMVPDFLFLLTSSSMFDKIQKSLNVSLMLKVDGGLLSLA